MQQSIAVITIILVLILVASPTFAQSGVLKLLFPDQTTEAIVTDECAGTGKCCIPTAIADKVCTSEGTYILNFKYTGDVQSAGEVLKNAHAVNWDTEQYCKGTESTDVLCFQNKSVNFSSVSGKCCGARPSRDCGLRSGTEVCVNPTKEPEHWELMHLAENHGDIIDVDCAQTQLVSDGTEFYGCGLYQGIATQHPTFDLLEVTRSGVDQYQKHGYLCAEPDPGNNNTHPEIIECLGDGRSYNQKQGNIGQIGEAHQRGELFFAQLGRDDVIQTGALGNFNGASGKLIVKLNNTWAGSEDLTRVIFFAEADLDTYISIEKSKNKLTCNAVNGGSSIKTTFDISSLTPSPQSGIIHTIILTWNTNGQFICSFDGVSQTKTGYNAINVRELFVNTGPRGAQGSQSPMRARISKDANAPILYCTKDAQWVKDLDTKDSITCRAAGLRWTGSKCCSEDEDLPGESYNDKDPPNYNDQESGACFKSAHVANGFLVPQTNDTVLAILGEFYGCQLNETAPHFLALTDTHTGKPLINTTNRCTLAYNATRNVNVNYYCSFRNNWTRTLKQDQLFPRSVAPEVRSVLNPAQNRSAIDTECCPQQQCWSGIACVNDQRNDPNPRNTIKGFRCIGGNWTTMTPKHTFDDRVFGFCPRNEQCLVNPSANASANDLPHAISFAHPERGPICITNGQYILQSITRGDATQSTSTYCNNGSWTSRTNILASYLASIGETQAPNNYALFCDRFRNTLNFFEYRALPDANFVSHYMDATCTGPDKTPTPCVNEFCVLKYGDKVAWGTTLNKPINDSREGFLNAVGKPVTHCDNALQDDAQFHACGANMWHNNALGAIIHLPTGAVPGITTTEALTAGAAYIEARMQAIDTFMESATLADFRTFILSTHMFENLYINRAGQKDLFAFLQTNRVNGTPIDYLAARYMGINITDPRGVSGCDLIRNRITVDLAKDCKTVGTTNTFVGVQTPGEGNLRIIWQDFTAKLRK
ncbi:hypothetical protein HY641_04895 [Candidatus Woesearchaeota archaeon]|nr:hypothetical protein [Candidatus Woesearchaeota archaeon]